MVHVNTTRKVLDGLGEYILTVVHFYVQNMHEEEFEDTKGVVRIHKLKKGQITQWPKEKRRKDKQ